MSNAKGRDFELSKDAIVTMLQLPISSSPYTVNIIVQVHNINKKDFVKYANLCYTSTLSDEKYRYCGFIIQRYYDKEVQCGDIINIQSIVVLGIHKGNERVFIIKKYEILQQYSIIFQNLPIATNEVVKRYSSNNIKNKSSNSDKDNSLNEYDNNGNNSDIEDNVNEKESQSDNSKDKDSNYISANEDFANDILEFMYLSELNTFSKNIVIYCKIIKKCELKSFINKLTNQKSKLLSFDLCDCKGFEMQATIFDKCSTQINSKLKEGEIYLIKGGYVKVNDKKYTNIKSDFKIIFDHNTIFTHIKKETDNFFSNNIPQKKSLQFIKLVDLPKYHPNSIVDCLVYVLDSSNRNIKQSKSKEVSYRRLIVGDISGKKCELTLWKKFSDIDIKIGNYLILKYIRVSEYNGIRLSSVDDSVISLNPDDSNFTELKELKQYVNDHKDKREWVYIQSEFDVKENSFSTVINIQMTSSYITSETSEYIPVYYIREVLNKIGENCRESHLIKIKATICEIAHSVKNFYRGCPEKQCKKKLVYYLNKETYEDEYFCQGCNKIYNNPYYYYTMNIKVKDVSAEHYVDFFGDTVMKLFGIKADDYKNLINNNDIIQLKEISNKLEYHTFFFIGKANYQVYNNKRKKKFFAYRYEAINNNLESKRILNNIKLKFNLNV